MNMNCSKCVNVDKYSYKSVAAATCSGSFHTNQLFYFTKTITKKPVQFLTANED
jgi:hypothetical protein